jgi:hypothetical protein
MGDTSQSRYSIVERLIRAKLDIMSARLVLKDDIKQAEQEHKMMTDTLSNQIEYIKDNAKRQQAELQQQVRVQELKVANLHERYEEQDAVYAEKIKALDNALDRIETISKSSVVDES